MKKLAFNLTLFFAVFFMMDTIYAQDWPDLNRYQKENELLDKSEKNKNRVVFMGNSITEGWSTHDPSFFQNKSFINRGISGQTTPQMLIRFRQDVVDLKPNVVVILAGINDIAGNTGPSSLKMIADNIRSMVEIALVNDIKVILCSVLPAKEFSWSPEVKPAHKVIDLNKMIRVFAEEKKVHYVDYFQAMVDSQNGLKSEYTYDGVHPNKAGYQVMGPLVKEAIDLVEGKK